jgi:ABC-2 type transport system permease protein
VTQLAEMRNQGAFELFALSPLRVSSFMVAEVSARIMLTMVQTVICVTLGMLLGGIETAKVFAVCLVMVLGIMMMLMFSFLLSPMFKTNTAITNLTGLPSIFLFLNGTFLPFEILPDFVRVISYFIPLTYFSETLKLVMIDTYEGTMSIGFNVLILVCITLVLAMITIMTFTWNNKK